jgi:putative CocE/NonD family hydrolase
MFLSRIIAAGVLAILGLADAVAAQVENRFGLVAPMRDGVKLSADLWMPATPGKYPTLVIRTPYMKAMPLLKYPELGQYFASRGYIVFLQDVRGRGDSDGDFNFFFQEAQDGFDTIEWIARQPWSNGRVGMMGVSYLATVQWLAAREKPPHLVCMAPTAAAGRYQDELPWVGGAFRTQWSLGWLNGTSGRNQQGNTQGVDWQKVLNHRPLLTADSVLGRPMRLYREFIQNAGNNAYWRRIQFSPEDFAKIDIPTLTVTGWFDADQPGALFYWRGLQERSPSKDKHFLVSGPWDHVQTFNGGSTKLGAMEFTTESIIDNKALHVAFFDWCLKGSAPKFVAPRARVYVTGANVWRELDNYPPANAKPQQLYLTSGGRANSLVGDGKLSWQAPASDPPDQFTYDPKKPVPSDLAGEYLAIDRRPIERRDDVLVYTSDSLTSAIEVMGNIVVNLEAASDARDTDFTAVLTDVYPDGSAVALGPYVGIRRGRYRKGMDREEMLTPGQAEKFQIELFDIAHSFQPGHRIRLEISSSAAPLYNPNQNTGNPVATDTVWRIARQIVYHDRVRASAITLPVVNRTAIP